MVKFPVFSTKRRPSLITEDIIYLPLFSANLFGFLIGYITHYRMSFNTENWFLVMRSWYGSYVYLPQFVLEMKVESAWIYWKVFWGMALILSTCLNSHGQVLIIEPSKDNESEISKYLKLHVPMKILENILQIITVYRVLLGHT